jgi:hypothetical protein
MRCVPALLALGLFAGLMACQDSTAVAPDDIQPQFGKPGLDCTVTDPHPSCKDGDSGPTPTVVAWASGDYWMTVERFPEGTPDQNRWTWFDAKMYSDMTVVGEWRVERFSIPSGRRVSKSSGKINCFTIEGDNAWFGGTQKGVPGPNNHVLWRVVDGASASASASDAASLACNRMPYPGGYAGCIALAEFDSDKYCSETPLHPELGPTIDKGEVILWGVTTTQ